MCLWKAFLCDLCNPKLFQISRARWVFKTGRHLCPRFPISVHQSRPTMSGTYTFALAAPSQEEGGDSGETMVGVFNEDGILVEEFSTTSARSNMRTELLDILARIDAGETRGSVQNSYTSPKSVSEIQGAMSSTSSALRDRSMLLILAKMMAPSSRSEVLVINDNCHSAALYGHRTMLELDRFQIDRYSGRGDDFPRLTVSRSDYAKTMGSEPSIDLEFAKSGSGLELVVLRRVALNAFIQRGLSGSHENDDRASEILLVNGHRNCTHRHYPLSTIPARR